MNPTPPVPTPSGWLARPLLGAWPRAARYLLAVLVGALAWIAQAAALLSAGAPAGAQRDRVGAALALDLLLGAAVLALLPLRRRHPLPVACLAVLLAPVSVSGLGGVVLVVASLATSRRRGGLVLVGALSAVGAVLSQGLYRPWLSPSADGGAFSVVVNVLLVMMIFVAAVLTGGYVAARRELLASLRERAATAEREQALTDRAARADERTRIARDMHDDLAHRISLVALHAGVLTYREDLSRAETAAAALTIQTNAQLALTELRQVLGVLRDGRVVGEDGVLGDGGVLGGGRPDEAEERSQPSLAELPALLADAREAGAAVRLEAAEGLLAALPEQLSRISFRVVQEALTNARKHAPGAPVAVSLAGAAGDALGIEVRNPLGPRREARTAPGPGAGPGLGLAGLGERAELVGGRLRFGVESDGEFVLRASLPWPA